MVKKDEYKKERFKNIFNKNWPYIEWLNLVWSLIKERVTYSSVSKDDKSF